MCWERKLSMEIIDFFEEITGNKFNDEKYYKIEDFLSDIILHHLHTHELEVRKAIDNIYNTKINLKFPK